MWNRILQSNKGMSLVEVMVTASVASVLMVAIGNSLLSLYQHQSSVSKKDIGNEFAADLSRMLSDNGSCSSMFQRANPPVTLPADGTKISFSIPDFLSHKKQQAIQDPVVDDLTPGNEVYSGLKCTSLTVNNSSLADRPKLYDGREYVVRIAEIEMGLSIVQVNGDRELKPRRFKVPVLVDPSNNVIAKCDTGLELAESCETLGATYDTATGQCVPEKNCFMRGTYMTSVCTPASSGCESPQVNQISGSLSCPAPSVASQTGSYVNTFTEGCGKKCTRTITNTISYYVCMWCD